MTNETLQCSLITPEARVFEGLVESVVIPAHDGEIGILRNRAPLLCRLGAGPMRVRIEGVEERWFIDSGFAQVLDNRVVVLTQTALRPDEIDRSEAEALLADAHKIQAVDEISEKRKSQAEAGARARLRMIR